VYYKTVQYQKSGQIGSIILNRPEVNNAINARLAGELADICSEITHDRDVRVVTITGAGKFFCAGTDWDSYPPSPATNPLSVSEPVAGLKCPVIAAINGDALGQGLELALACDLRVVAETARLGFPQIASGLMPCDGGTQRLPRLIGRARAIEMILLGEAISATDAHRIGLVNRIVGLEELPQITVDMAQRISSSAPLALKYAKEAVVNGVELTLEQGLRLEADLYLLLQTTEDRTEGITAFQQKRRPEFKGK
jgi:enoyl-CoA hydratase/carnithine racemase